MTGTNTSSLYVFTPKDKVIALRGVDLIKMADDGIKLVTGCFDTKVIPTQLRLNVTAQPSIAGRFRLALL